MLRETSFLKFKFNSYESKKNEKTCIFLKNSWQCESFLLLLPMSTRRERAKAQKPQLNSQLEVIPKMKVNQRKEKLGTYFVDVSKYVLTGVIITSLFKDMTNKASIYLLGLFIVLFTLWAGLRLTSKIKE
jgi:hypothetical protein